MGSGQHVAAQSAVEQGKRLLLNSPILLGVITKHLTRGRLQAVSVGLRAAPRSVRQLWFGPLGRALPTVAALARAADGRLLDATQLLDHRAGDPELPQRARIRAVEALLVLHQLESARTHAAVLPSPSRARVRLLMAEGHWQTAHSEAKRAKAGLLRRWAAGELATVATEHRIRPARPTRPTPDHQRRVLHLVTTSLPEAQTGYTIRTQGIAAAQQNAGTAVTVVTRIGFPVDAGHPTAPPERIVDGVVHRRLLPTKPLTLSAGRRLDSTVEAVTRIVAQAAREGIPYSVIHAHSKHDNAQVALAVRARTGVPVVYEVRGFLEETWRTRGGSADTDLYRLTQQAELECMRAADHVTTLSESMRTAMISRGVPADRITVVGNAVPADYLIEPQPQSQARASLGIEPDRFVVVFAGTLNDYEGLGVLIEATRLSRSQPLLVIAGDGPARNALEAAAAGLDVRFLGKLPHADVRAVINAADLYAIPRLRTPVTELVPPLKPLEALASGVPVLMSDLPPLEEYLEQAGQVGWLAPADSPQAWAQALDERATERHDLTHAGRLGREWVTAHRTWPLLALKYDSVYQKLEDVNGSWSIRSEDS